MRLPSLISRFERKGLTIVALDLRTIDALQALFQPPHIKGHRYNAQARSEVDTEEAE